ncbi:MAG: ferric iron reductase [Micromonosporaceae bacterium]
MTTATIAKASRPVSRGRAVDTLADRYNDAGWFPTMSLDPSGPDWIRLADLLADGGAALADTMRGYGERVGSPPETIAAHFAGWIAGSFVRPLVWAYTTQRWVPLFTGDGIVLHRAPGGWFDQLAPGEPVLAVLASDPLADQSVAGARPVESTDELRRLLAGTVTTLATPVVETLKALSRLGRRTLWALVSDTVASAFLMGDQVGPASRRAAAEAARVLALGGPLNVRRRWVYAQGPHTYGTVPVAAACCLAYKTPDGGYCERVCPKLDEQTRREQVSGWLADLSRSPHA